MTIKDLGENMTIQKLLKIVIIIGCILLVSTVTVSSVTAHTTQEGITPLIHTNNPPSTIDHDEEESDGLLNNVVP